MGVDIRYHAPLRFDDAFTVTCALVERARATFRLAYRVELDGRLMLGGRTRHAVLDRETARPGACPDGSRPSRSRSRRVLDMPRRLILLVRPRGRPARTPAGALAAPKPVPVNLAG